MLKKLLVKLLGLETLEATLETLRKENEAITNRIKELEDSVETLDGKVDVVEDFDPDNYVKERDLDDQIDTWMSNSDYATQDWVQGEIGDIDVSDKIEEAIDDLDLTDKVEEIVKEMDKASFGDTEELKTIIRDVLKTIKFKVE